MLTSNPVTGGTAEERYGHTGLAGLRREAQGALARAEDRGKGPGSICGEVGRWAVSTTRINPRVA
jgi:hypothetical protein